MGATWVFEDVTATPLLIFLLQLALTLIVTRVLGKLLGLLKEPQVIGEVIGGIIMGPSVLGRIPGFTAAVFPTAAPISAKATYDSTVTFSVIATVGLILFMFLMGCELDRKLLSREWKFSLPIAASAIAVPFSTGALASLWLRNVNAEGQPDTWSPPSNTSFLLFFGASMSFTAFPVLASILSASQLLASPLGVLSLSTAACDDIVAWCVLAIATSFSKHGSAVEGVYTCVLAMSFVAIMTLVLRPALLWAHVRLDARGHADSRYYFCFLVLLLIGAAYATEVIGIHPFFGAFVMGIITPKTNGFVQNLLPRMELVVTEVLLPLYFVNSGVKTNIGTLNTIRLWGITLAITLLACMAKFLPSCLMTRLLTRRSWAFSSTLGVLMNTRGLVELIALNIGLSMGILSTQLFTMMVIMAIVTTLITSPAVWALYLRRFPDGVEPGEKGEAQCCDCQGAAELPSCDVLCSERCEAQPAASTTAAASAPANAIVDVEMQKRVGDASAHGPGH